MDLSDHEFDELLALVKLFAIKAVRITALTCLAWILSSSQNYLAYPNGIVAFLVFVLSASGYAARMAYFIIFYLAFLVLLPSEAATFLKNVAALLLSKFNG
jgi:hypothetical protein